MDIISITKAAQLKDLDDKELIQGYWDGKENAPKPGDNRSYSYSHGWKNGMMDGKHMLHDEAARQLAHDVVESGYFRNKETPK